MAKALRAPEDIGGILHTVLARVRLSESFNDAPKTCKLVTCRKNVEDVVFPSHPVH